MSLFGWLGLGVLAFASTNVDDLFVLIAFFSQPDYLPWQVVLGQYAGLGIVISLSLAGALASLAIPHHWIGFLGLVPMLLGALRLARRRRTTDVMPVLSVPKGLPTGPGSRGLSNILAVALVTISNGSDNVATYVPLFASAGRMRSVTLIVLFLGLIAVWCRAGYWLVNHDRWGDRVRRGGELCLPYLLIGLGILILVRSLLLA